MNNILTDETIQKFQKKIFSWWEEHKREFPWRKSKNPYEILVAEFMLQQTQASRIINPYKRFLKNWPTLAGLAKENSSNIIRFWSEHKLGYNRRAKWLHEAAIQINKLDSFPTTPKELRKLKGIGSYCSRSILIFAFNSDLATVDTNIRRILISERFASKNTTESELLAIAEQLTPPGKSRDWHNALMDFGAVYKTARKTGIRPKTIQKSFKNSTRAHRGAIIRFLSSNDTLTLEMISKKLKLSKQETSSILSTLIKDQMIKKEDDKYSIFS